MNRKIVCVVLLCLTTACTEDTLVHSYKPISDEGWWRNDTLVYTLPPQSTDLHCTASVEVRISNAFALRELWLEVEKKVGENSQKDTVMFRLADESENLDGEGFNLLQYAQEAGHIDLKANEEASLRIRHLMEREIIPHICEVGIRVDKQ